MIVIEPPSSSSGEAAFQAVRKPELSRFLKQAQRALELQGEVTLLLADNNRIRDLNRSFRGKNKTTDVLSFPAAENGEGVAGDLAISVPIAATQAATHGHTLAEELRILTLHGLLHLAGYDHETDSGEMRAREAELREQFSLPVSLIERTLARPQKKARPGKTLTHTTKSPKKAVKSAGAGASARAMEARMGVELQSTPKAKATAKQIVPVKPRATVKARG